MVFVLIAVFVTSLLLAGGAAGAFTRRLEIISDRWLFSPGLLSLLGALGANIPNYVASWASAISGQVGVGIGIIVGSNIYNMAVILGLSAFASPARQGMTLERQAAQDVRLVGGITLAIVVMAGETAATDLHFPSAILSLIILAIATSLPNTVVAFTLARTGRASARVEEIFSSNGVNAALGIALPLLFWPSIQEDCFLVTLDGPLMVVLACVALLLVLKRRVSRAVGLLLVLIYIAWVLIHVLL